MKLKLLLKYLKWLNISIVLLFVITLILVFPFWAAHSPYFDFFLNRGEVGDTFGGLISPIAALVGVILTFFAFMVQYEANRIQKEQFQKSLNAQEKESRDQGVNWQIERFENRFFELLKIHKENVSEMSIHDRVFGRKCFVPMFYELKYTYTIVDAFIKQAEEADRKERHLDKINKLRLAYYMFFYGIGYNSEKQYYYKLTEAEKYIFDHCRNHFKDLRSSYNAHMYNHPESKHYTANIPFTGNEDKFTIKFYNIPLDGHINKLGHYFRHLYQTAIYVTQQSFLNHSQKEEYLKTLRAQLSNFEQLVLYYNASAWFEDKWSLLFVNYRLIKNIPIELADFDISPVVRYSKQIDQLWTSKGKKLFDHQINNI